jgi:hypothetical protein|nr:MAG TPA: hypothetical protein [Caudoviricetes sp.]
MTAIIHRQTTYSNNREVTTIRVFGVPVFKRVIIDNDERTRRSCGFNVIPSDAPGHFTGDFDDDSDTNDR